MVALRSLFLTGLVVAVNSKREIMNEDGNRGGFTPVSKITFLQKAATPPTEGIATFKKKAEDGQLGKNFKFDDWKVGHQDQTFLSALRSLAHQVAEKIDTDGTFQVTDFDMKPYREKLANLLVYATKDFENLTPEHFQSEFWASKCPRYLTLDEEIKELGKAVASLEAGMSADVKAASTPLKAKKIELKEKKDRLENMSPAAKIDEKRELYVSAKTAFDLVEDIWIGVDRMKTDYAGGRAVIKSKRAAHIAGLTKLKEKETTKADAIIELRRNALADIYVAGPGFITLGELMKLLSLLRSALLVCLLLVVAVGVVIGAFAYDVYTRKSDTVHAPGEGLV